MPQKKQQHGGRYQTGIYQQAKESKAGSKALELLPYTGPALPPRQGRLPPYQVKRKRQLKEKSKHSNPSYGWSLRSPKPGTERHILKQRCGAKCFLAPETEGFPICTKYSITAPNCRLDCGGVLSAYRRARQYKHDLALEAEMLWHTAPCLSLISRRTYSTPR